MSGGHSQCADGSDELTSTPMTVSITLTTLQPSMHKLPIHCAPWSVSHAAVLPIHAVELGAMLCTRSQVAQPCMVAHPTTATVATPAMVGMLVT